MVLKRWSYNLRYLLSRAPWDTNITPPEVVQLIEGERLPPGRALDLGCGSGTNSLYLARHGWEVVGVDFSRPAIRRARRKARRAGITSCRFYLADVTRLGFLQEPFDLALDIGCLHGIPPDRRPAYAAELTRLLRPGGLYMLYAFTPRSPTRGIAPEEVRELLTPAFVLEKQQGGADPSGSTSFWYRIRRGK